MNKGKNDKNPIKDSPSVNLDHMHSSDGMHSGVSHPPVSTVKDPMPDTQAHDKARKDHFRRAGLTAKGGSAPRDKKGAKSK